MFIFQYKAGTGAVFNISDFPVTPSATYTNANVDGARSIRVAPGGGGLTLGLDLPAGSVVRPFTMTGFNVGTIAASSPSLETENTTTNPNLGRPAPVSSHDYINGGTEVWVGTNATSSTLGYERGVVSFDTTSAYSISSGNQPEDDEFSTENVIGGSFVINGIRIAQTSTFTNPRVFVCGQTNIYEIDTGQPFNPITGEFVVLNNTYNVGSVLTGTPTVLDVEFTANGLKMLALVTGAGTEGNVYHQFSLASAWDLTTVTYDNISVTLDDDAISFALVDNNTKLFTVSDSTNTIRRYDV